MQDNEYDDYLSYFIEDYADEIAKNFKLTLKLAGELARTEIARDLKDGPSTKGHSLFCIINSAEGVDSHVGYVWYKTEEDADRIFICDFHILPSFQNKGLGKSALQALDSHLTSLGVSQIRLRVAIENSIALHLYEKSGYKATGINMFKEIGNDINLV